MRALALSAMILLAASVGARAQPYSSGSNSALSPAQSFDDSAGSLPSDFLRAALGALAAGRTKQAQDALEMAQTRLLDRSVPLGQTNDPSDNPVVGEISQARQALAAHDRLACLQLIQAAIGTVTSQGL